MLSGLEAHNEVDPRLLEPGKEPTVAEFPIKNQGLSPKSSFGWKKAPRCTRFREVSCWEMVGDEKIRNQKGMALPL